MLKPCNSDRLLDDINLRAKVLAKPGAFQVCYC